MNGRNAHQDIQKDGCGMRLTTVSSNSISFIKSRNRESKQFKVPRCKVKGVSMQKSYLSDRNLFLVVSWRGFRNVKYSKLQRGS